MGWLGSCTGAGGGLCFGVAGIHSVEESWLRRNSGVS